MIIMIVILTKYTKQIEFIAGFTRPYKLHRSYNTYFIYNILTQYILKLGKV